MQNNTITLNRVTYDLKTNADGTGSWWCLSKYNEDECVPTIVIPDEIDGIPVKEIGEYAFNSYLGLRTVEINCDTITLRANAFYRCRNLSMITFHQLNRIKAEPKAIAYPDPHLVLIATTECRGHFKIDAFTTYSVNRIFRKNGAVVQ